MEIIYQGRLIHVHFDHIRPERQTRSSPAEVERIEIEYITENGKDITDTYIPKEIEEIENIILSELEADELEHLLR